MIRFRRIIAGICLILAAVLAVFACTGIWLERNYLNTDRFTHTVNRVIEDKAVQAAIAEQVSNQITQGDKRLEIAKPFLEPIIQQVVASDAFRKVFDQAVRNAHKVVTGSKAKEIVLNISDVVDDVRGVLQEVAPDLAARIPTGEKVEVTILQKSKLQVVWDTIDLVENIITGIVVAFFVLLILGFVIAPYRWRSLGLFGAAMSISGVVLFVIFTVSRMVVEAQVNDTTVRLAINHAWNIILSGLMWTSVILAIVGAVLFVCGRFIDRSGGWSTSWRLLRTAWSHIGRTAVTVGSQAAQATRSAVARADASARAGAATSESEAVTDASTATHGAPDVAAQETGQLLGTIRRVWGGLRPVWRAVMLLAVALLALFQPSGVVRLLVVFVGLVLLWFAFLEGVAAWRSNRPEEPVAPPAP